MAESVGDSSIIYRGNSKNKIKKIIFFNTCGEPVKITTLHDMTVGIAIVVVVYSLLA